MINDDRCCEDRAFCRTCPERCFSEEKPSCFPEEMPVTTKKPSPLGRVTHIVSQWVSRIRLPGLAQIGKAIQRVKKKE